MFGDDPDPTVTKVRFGFGEVSDTGEGAMHCAKRDSGLGKRENEEQGWSRNGQQKQGGDVTTTSGCKFYENMRMQCS